MQKVVRLDDYQARYLRQKAAQEFTVQGYLHYKHSDGAKWQLKFFSLYQNLLFAFDSDSCAKPHCIILLEGCFCEKTFALHSKNKEVERMVRVLLLFETLFV